MSKVMGPEWVQRLTHSGPTRRQREGAKAEQHTELSVSADEASTEACLLTCANLYKTSAVSTATTTSPADRLGLTTFRLPNQQAAQSTWISRRQECSLCTPGLLTAGNETSLYAVAIL